MNDPHGLCRKWREVIRSEHIPLAWDREEEGDITGWEILLEEERFREKTKAREINNIAELT